LADEDQPAAVPAVQAALISSAEYRLMMARTIASRLRHDEDLHRLAMTGVFALEDLLFEMHRAPSDVATLVPRRERKTDGA
jgi:hypothetical protein